MKTLCEKIMKTFCQIISASFLLLLLVDSTVMAQQAKRSSRSVRVKSAKSTIRSEPNVGMADGRNYTNDFFGLKLILPEGWHMQNLDDGVKSSNAENKAVKSKTSAKRKEDSQWFHNSKILLTIFKYEKGTTNSFNPSFSLIVEKIDKRLKVKTPKKYLERTVKEIENVEGAIPFEVDDEIHEGEIGGRLFAAINVKSIGIFNQIYCVTFAKGYIIIFLLSYAKEEDEKTLGEVMNSVRFE